MVIEKAKTPRGLVQSCTSTQALLGSFPNLPHLSHAFLARSSGVTFRWVFFFLYTSLSGEEVLPCPDFRTIQVPGTVNL